jgi:hypothetical protein
MLQNLVKDAPLLPGSSEEFRRLEYSLKLNLRLLNGKFNELKIHRVNQSSPSFSERFLDKTQIECMEMVTPANREHFETLTQLRGRLNISRTSPKKFTFGTIIENAEDLMADTEYTFCVFRIGVGRSYCHPAVEEVESIALKEGFDSVFLEPPADQPSRLFRMQYVLFNSDNAILTHVIKCRIDVGELQQALELEVCALCSEPAAVFCEDD